MSKFSQRLGEALASRQISQVEFASRMSASAQSVSRWLKGDVTPRPAAVHRMEEVLGLKHGSLNADDAYAFGLREQDTENGELDLSNVPTEVLLAELSARLGAVGLMLSVVGGAKQVSLPPILDDDLTR
jgi:transcriptional regulator with XRE-family HTH domain